MFGVGLGIYLRHFRVLGVGVLTRTNPNPCQGYLGDLMRLRTEAASKGDLLGTEEWTGFSASSLFSSKPASTLTRTPTRTRTLFPIP